MSSSTKNQTIDGYVTEYANTHGVSPMQAIQTAMTIEVIKSFNDRDIAIQFKKGEETWDSQLE